MDFRSSTAWRDLPPNFDHWKNVHQRFCRWGNKGVWERFLGILIDAPDYEWLSHARKSSCTWYGYRWWQPRHGSYKRKINSKIQDAHGMPIRILITSGTTADCTQGTRLIEGPSAEHLLADRGDDSNQIIDKARQYKA